MAVLVSSLISQKAGSFVGGVLWSRMNAIFTPMLVKVQGREHVDRKTSYVVVSNHQSYYDIFLIYGWLGMDIKWVMKKELAFFPGIGFGSRKVGHIFIDRSSKLAALETLDHAARKLVNGTSVVIFPEGTRSTTGEMGAFKRGAFKLALDLGLPILPLSISGTREILPAGTLNLLPGKAVLTIHEPIDIKEYNNLSINELIQRTYNTIKDARQS